MKLDKRQKILIPLIIIAFIYIGWQIYEIFIASPAQVTSPLRIQQTPSAQVTQPEPTRVAGTKPDQIPVFPPTTKREITAPQHKRMEELPPGITPEESATYLRLMKQYQELEAKRMLLQEQMDIAETKQKIAELNAKLAQMPGAEVGQVGRVNRGETYKLIYLDQQRGQWSAVLSDRNNVFQEVKFGTKLIDSSRVIAINSKGVVIKKGQKITKLTFSGAVLLRTPISSEYKVILPIKPMKQPRSKQKNIKVTVVKPKQKIVKPAHVVTQPKPKVKVAKLVYKPAKLVQKPKVIKPAIKPNYTVHAVQPRAIKPTAKPAKTVVKVAPKPAKLVQKPKVIKPTIKPNFTVQTVQPTAIKSTLKPPVPITAKSNTLTVVKLTPKPTKQIKKPKVAKSVDFNYHAKITPSLEQSKPSKSKVVGNTEVTQLVASQKKVSTAKNKDNPIILMN